ncbi:putative procollagen-proline 4-dioxygenase [Helianthus annuus]|uniref:Procollagen-proline 4-dioxygenase n=1 Tax=Helianthus annuus TaxID=4232 RepID=A0A251TXJ7_HELAN|nr:putative procollagen-proline 4-dioxygenase [Helianthus annuus]KAJ0526394.1 putative procollagen-proline 4-dioxygenase [Helianthus annuus]KAJ0534820.1 putative procollagen-proline 4-dioxygenase [Helianthus annuus]KAJ0542785.1 putative procollagen-proline 4-dioxygenase [Helianthus annuus]KAJ0707843.1 putative procollagen-proline 4-dioxygenase [Helianthus annuus]
MASKSRLLPRGPSRRSSSSMLIFSIMIICSFFVLILLALGILSIPSNSNDSPKAHDLNSIVHRTTTVDRSEKKEDKDRSDQWVEVISWEPRAVVYHNFLVRVLYIYNFFYLYLLCVV